MESLEVLLTIVIVLMFIFPFGYAFYKKLNNKILFIFSVFGAETIVSALLMGASLPIAIQLIYIFPQLQANGYTKNIDWIFKIINIIVEYWFMSMPVLLVVLPVLLHRYYENIFGYSDKNKSANT